MQPHQARWHKTWTQPAKGPSGYSLPNAKPMTGGLRHAACPHIATRPRQRPICRMRNIAHHRRTSKHDDYSTAQLPASQQGTPTASRQNHTHQRATWGASIHAPCEAALTHNRYPSRLHALLGCKCNPPHTTKHYKHGVVNTDKPHACMTDKQSHQPPEQTKGDKQVLLCTWVAKSIPLLPLAQCWQHSRKAQACGTKLEV